MADATPIRVDRHDSPLGRWLLARWEPRHLAGIVQGIWYFEGSLTHLRERHFPSARSELVVHLGPVYRQVDGARTDPFPLACVSGLMLRPDVIEAPPEPNTVLGVRLHPMGAFALLGLPLDALTGLTVDLESVNGAEARRLVDTCEAARGPEARLRAAARWIEQRVRAGPDPDPAVAWMAAQIERHAGAVSIGALAARTGWSTTRLTGTFREQVGVTPKLFARVLRFRSALEMVASADRALAEVALAAGYYDQSHFSADFREMSGFSPSAYRAAHRFPDSPSLAEHAD